MDRIRLGMVGGGKDAFIGAVHRIAARIDGQYDLVAGALSASPDKARESGLALGLDPDAPPHRMLRTGTLLVKHRPGRFAGPAYRVNVRYERIGDEPCYPSIAALPETPDCVFVAVPREAVEGIVQECAARGVGGVVLFSSGYAETGLDERMQASVDA